MNNPRSSPKRNRRQFLQQSVATGTALAATAVQAPHVYATQKYVVRVLGTHVTLQEPLRIQAEKELGIELVFSPGGDASILHKASTRPDSFDLYEHWSNSIRVLWQAETIQPIEVSRIRYWDEVNGLSKLGRLNPDVKYGQGDAPHRLLFVQDQGQLGSRPTLASAPADRTNSG